METNYYQKENHTLLEKINIREEHNKIDISKLDKIISIDIKEKTIIVEPRVTMEKIVRFTKYYNLIPKVIPEFKGITVGGT
ncbi:delta(24)-sterol reductase [Anaeramoeba ignava]|uniref:Delta(24)-sterol reductase n=1 Tax=Anaeramoeba ignava TaxID=1746090 RepID=A0A9Q0L814_ANAIG|nr:delta(24)-sterol reductase [Anaeramoeba ignava]